MRILSLATNGAGRALLAATRAPDLWRRDIAALTGDAHLHYVAIVPAGASIDDIIARLEVWIAGTGAEPASTARFANTPTRIFLADPERIARWLRLEIERAARPPSHPARILARVHTRARRGLRRRWRTLLAVARRSVECGCFISGDFLSGHVIHGHVIRNLDFRRLFRRTLPGRS